MAEMLPTNPTHDNGGTPEAKPVSSAIPAKPRLPFLIEEIWELLLLIQKIVQCAREDLGRLGQWCGRNPAGALALAGIVGTVVYYCTAITPFNYGSISLTRWFIEGSRPGSNQAHARIVPLIAAALIWYRRDKFRSLLKWEGSALGLLPLGIGMLFFLAGIRCMNPRMSLGGLPFLIYGSTLFLWGGAVARVILFPCAFLVFMIPVGALEQATNNLQFIITGSVGAISHALGLSIFANGTTLTATDGSFHFEIAEGCSGIRSITAMTMLTAGFVHLTQDRFWKKAVIFGCSVVFALVGNVGRILVVVLVARFYDPKLAAGLVHDNASFVFFPVAILAMLGFAHLVNLDYAKLFAKAQSKTQTLTKEPVSHDD